MHWTPLVIVKDQSSHMINIKVTNLYVNNSFGRRGCEKINGRTNLLKVAQVVRFPQVVCFQMLEIETSAEVSNSIQIF